MQGIHFGSAPKENCEGSRGSQTEEGESTARLPLQPGPIGELWGASHGSELSAGLFPGAGLSYSYTFQPLAKGYPGGREFSGVKSSLHGETNELQ